MSYRVRTNLFEGPFDLLVYLIEHARMSIYDIRISEITAQYMKYVEQMREADVNLASEFMVLAAQLLEIKSKMLLPRTVIDEEGETVYEDPRTELVAKLAEYKKYKAASEMLEERREIAAASLEKPQEDLTEFTGEPDEYLILDADKFKLAFEDFLQRKKRLDEIRAHHIRTEKQRITTEARIAGIRNFFRELPEGQRANFNELVQNKESKYDISVTFSSVLEMMKERQLDAEQRKLFGDIEVYATEHLMDDPAPADETTVEGEQPAEEQEVAKNGE
ncbi:MAG: segregation/condensation protein A [Firmicutes bacterium]|nr:segregation/condensation protein A [Bacillota bacterium]